MKNSIKINMDDRGGLGVINLEDIPFVPKRFFWIFKTPPRTPRAGHGHKACEQFLICQSGKILIRVTNSDLVVKEVFLNPGDSYYLKTKNWLELVDFSEDAIMGVWASELYDRTEYIETYQDFLDLISN